MKLVLQRVNCKCISSVFFIRDHKCCGLNDHIPFDLNVTKEFIMELYSSHHIYNLK